MLQTLPWAEVDIEVITVETEHAGEVILSSHWSEGDNTELSLVRV